MWLPVNFYESYVTVMLMIIASISWVYYSWRRPWDLPPGPPCIPIIGNLPTVNKKSLVVAIREWRKQYGDVVSFCLGTKWVVVMSGYENLREAFIEAADDFSNRPDLFVNRYINEKRGIIGTEGETWKALKSFTLGALKKFGFGRNSLEDKIAKEVEIFLESVNETNGKNFYLDEKVNVSVSNIICSIAFGERYDYNDEKFVKLMGMLEDYISNSQLTAIVNFHPFVRYFPGDLFSAKKVLSNQKDIEDFIQERIEEHKDRFDEDNIKDFLDVAIKEMIGNSSGNSVLTENQIRKIIRDLFIAGTQTTATCIKWFVLYMIHHPEIQEKMWTEIDLKIGHIRPPKLSDRVNLSYCEAVIQESLRIGNITPLSVLHGASQDITFKGYRIPKGSVIVQNLDSVLMDDELFPSPETFCPERFLTSDGTFQRREKNIAFSLGRRACLGESMARMELFLFFVSLVQQFKFLPPKGKTMPEIKRLLGLQYSPVPFMFRAIKRF